MQTRHSVTQAPAPVLRPGACGYGSRETCSPGGGSQRECRDSKVPATDDAGPLLPELAKRVADCGEDEIDLLVRGRERRGDGDEVADAADDHALLPDELRALDAEHRCRSERRLP